MVHSTLCILVCLALASPLLTSPAEAGVVGSALAAPGRSPSVRPAQFVRPHCWYADGWNGRGWYRCGDEWNEGFGWIGAVNFPDFGGSAIRRHHRHRVGVAHPHPPAHVYERPRGLSAGRPPPFHSFGAGSGFRRFGAGRARLPAGPHAGRVHPPPAFHPPAPASPGFAAGRFHGLGAGRFHGLGAGGGRFHSEHRAGAPHVGAPASPGFAGHAFHGLGAGRNVHRGFHAQPGFRPPARAFTGGLRGFHAPSGFHAGRGPGASGFRGGGAAPSFGGHAGGAR